MSDRNKNKKMSLTGLYLAHCTAFIIHFITRYFFLLNTEILFSEEICRRGPPKWALRTNFQLSYHYDKYFTNVHKFKLGSYKMFSLI